MFSFWVCNALCCLLLLEWGLISSDSTHKQSVWYLYYVSISRNVEQLAFCTASFLGYCHSDAVWDKCSTTCVPSPAFDRDDSLWAWHISRVASLHTWEAPTGNAGAEVGAYKGWSAAYVGTFYIRAFAPCNNRLSLMRALDCLVLSKSSGKVFSYLMQIYLNYVNLDQLWWKLAFICT